MLFQDQLEQIKENTFFTSYFQHKDLYKFLNIYIKIDSILNENHDDNSVILNKLNNISNVSENNTINELLNILKLQFQLPQANLIKELNYTLDNHPRLSTIDMNISELQKNFSSSSSKKGETTENILFNNLIKVFNDSEVINTSQIPHSGDIQIKKTSKPMILIDSKNFQTNVGKNDLEKFYDDLKTNNCSGILCNSNAGIGNRDHLQIDIQDNNVYVFISNHQYDNSLFKLAVKIIYNIHEIIKTNKTGIISVDKRLFNRLKLEYMNYMSSFQQHLNNIKINIVSLEKLAFIQLDQFFKCTNFTTDITDFSCNVCGLPYKSDKTLKTHMKKHL